MATNPEIITLSSDESDTPKRHQLVKRRKKRLKGTTKKMARTTAPIVEERKEGDASDASSSEVLNSDIETATKPHNDITEEPEHYVPCRTDFRKPCCPADEETENSEFDEPIPESFEKLLLPAAQTVEYKPPSFAPEHKEAHHRACSNVAFVDLAYLEVREVVSNLINQDTEEKWMIPILAEKQVIRDLMSDTPIEEGKTKRLQRTFVLERPPVSSKRIMLAKDAGPELLNIYVDLNLTEEEKEHEIKHLSKLVYIKKNIKTFQRDEIPLDGQDKIACNCKMTSVTSGCCCVGNKKCACWAESNPRLSEDQAGVLFENVEWDNSIIFVCGKECACKGYCSNQFSLSRTRFRVEVAKKSVEMGFEVVAAEPIPPRQVIMPFLGEVISQEQFRSRAQSEGDPTAEYSYLLYAAADEEKGMFADRKVLAPQPNTTLYIDPSKKGNVARFMAHSCLPNTTPVRILRNSRRIEDSVLVVVATEPIPVGYSITLHYGTDYVKQRLAKVCLCNSPNCIAPTSSEKLKLEEILFEYSKRLKKLMVDVRKDVHQKTLLKSEKILQNSELYKLRKAYEQKVVEKMTKRKQYEGRIYSTGFQPGFMGTRVGARRQQQIVQSQQSSRSTSPS